MLSDDAPLAARWAPSVVALDVTTKGEPDPVPAARSAAARSAGPDDAIYVIYTSGSTGAPKGVLVAHRGVANVLRYAHDAFGVRPGAAVLALASFGFDFAALELLLPLTGGAAVHLLDRSVARDPARLAAAIADRAITHVMGTPSMFGAMTGAGWRPPPTLTVVAGGEVLPRPLAEQLSGAAALWNIYGPTETSIFCTDEQVRPDRDVTIGTPVPNMTVRIVDGDREVPDGDEGEIVVSGVGVALGYLDRPELTAARFVPDPVGGGLSYRTGDRGRIRPDGRIDYLGRADGQVKVRGFRIELGGIEATLLDHPRVREAAVVAQQLGPAPVLVAHVVGDGEDLVDVLRGYLGERLPSHEVPHRVLVTDQLPRNSNGKIDRYALSRPPEPVAVDEPDTPVTDDATTGELLDIYRDVLGRPDVGVDDDFFAAGGDSLSVLRVVSSASAAGIVLSADDVSRHSTVAELAAVDAVAPDAPAGAAPPTDPPADTRPLLLPSQRWFFELGIVDHSYFAEPVLMRVSERLDRQLLAAALAELATRHPVLRSRFDTDHADTAVALGSPASAFPLTWLDSTGLHDDQAAAAFAAAEDEACALLDISSGPVCRAVYAAADAGDRLLLVFHHLVIDGVSLQILAQDLELLVQARPPAAPPPSAFEHAAAVRGLGDHESSTRARQEWLALPWAEVGRLPAPVPADGVTRGETSSVTAVCDESLTTALRAVAESSVHHTEEVVLAAVATAVATFCGAATVAIDVFRNGRAALPGERDVSLTVGWLAGVVPHVLTVAADAGPAGQLSSLRQQIQHLRSLEHSWGALRYPGAEEAAANAPLTALARPQVYLHYRGHDLDQLPASTLLQPVSEHSRRKDSPANPTFADIEVRARIADGVLVVEWTYSTRMFDESDVRGLADDFVRHVATFTRDVRA